MKTQASFRLVPVHPAVLPKLIAHIGEQTSALIIDEVTEDKYGSKSSAISKRIGRLIDVVCPDPDVRKHSFRHTVVAKLADAGVHKEIRKAIVGRSSSRFFQL